MDKALVLHEDPRSESPEPVYALGVAACMYNLVVGVKGRDG